MADAKPTSKTWYRLTFDQVGKLQSMRASDKQHKPGERVFYVLAADKHQALELGRELWREYANAEAAEQLAARRERNQGEGLCRCGRQREGDFKKCSECRKLDNEHNRRHYKRQKGETVEPRDRRATLRERKQRDALKVAAVAYEEVLEAAGRCSSLGELKRFLRARLLKIDHELNGISKPEAEVA